MGTRNLLIAWVLGFCALTLVAMLVWVAAVGPTGKALPSALAGMLASPTLVVVALYHFVVYVGLHVLLAVAWAWLCRPLLGKAQPQVCLLSFLPLLLGILLWNRRLFPDSAFAADFEPAAAAVSDALLWAIIGYALLVTAAGIGVRLRSRKGKLFAAGVLALAALFAMVDAGLLRAGAALERQQPDVILIGVDGLRPDHVDPVLTPHLHALVAGSMQFERAWTPLARTFPAWVSLLTGRYPAAHGAVFNLVPRAQVDDRDSLAHELGGLGYHRVHAIDETRFSNIDRSFGFDVQVGPATGAFDFLLSAVGDLPLVNLVANTRAGQVLFPYAYANRALPVSYRPATFDRALARAVTRTHPAQPLFLAAHFELPHWPYTWAGSRAFRAEVPEHLRALAPPHYHAAVARADAQVGALVAELQRAGRLEHAVLVLLSDHGEAFLGLDARWHAFGTDTVMEVHAGHGTHVLSAAQNRVLLAFRGYGRFARGMEGVNSGTTASLVDIRPTLHQWLGLAPPQRPLDGVSLLTIGGVDRAVSLETGFSPPSVADGAPDVVALVEQSARYYNVVAGGRLALRDELLPELHADKQYAMVAGDWALASLPRPDGTRDLVLADRSRMMYWNVRSGGLPEAAPYELLFTALCAAVPEGSVDGCL
ncbi:MAG: sulfatase-like hydrolase/transferase [Xanthomonadaceae bacterium]|nr:sulfatase-like hydrolase/transferase [Xanthomonadaceae bacterium]